MQMLRNVLLFLLFSSAAPILAQTARGSWMLGGDARVSVPFRSGSFNIETSLNPRVGYFVGRNFVLGAALPLVYGTSVTNRNASRGYTINGETVKVKRINSINYGIAPFIRYYFNESKWRPFVQGQFGYSRLVYQTVPEDRPNITRKSRIITALPGVGLTYFINDNVGLEALLAYSYNSPSNPNHISSLGITFGLQFYLPRK